MANELMQNINKVHTTKLGEERIKKNLNLGDEDSVEWCKNKILSSKDIVCRGKNWYVNSGGQIITINKRSYTIITAHKNDL
jgi:hypothetical protein